jgi:hypothetical protein
MYPSVSSEVLSFFLCREVNGVSYLLADFNLQCGNAVWLKYLPLAIAGVVMYPIGIPLFLFISLFRIRKHLHEKSRLMAWGIVYEAYKRQFWWAELVDLVQKLFLTSLLGFFPSNAQCAVGMGLCILTLIGLLLAAPYVRRIDDRMALIVQVHLFLILLVGLVLQQTDYVLGSSEDLFASILMFIVLAALVLIAVYHLVVFIRKYVRNTQRRKLVAMTSNPMHSGGDDKTGRDSKIEKRVSSSSLGITVNEADSQNRGSGNGGGPQSARSRESLSPTAAGASARDSVPGGLVSPTSGGGWNPDAFQTNRSNRQNRTESISTPWDRARGSAVEMTAVASAINDAPLEGSVLSSALITPSVLPGPPAEPSSVVASAQPSPMQPAVSALVLPGPPAEPAPAPSPNALALASSVVPEPAPSPSAATPLVATAAAPPLSIIDASASAPELSSLTPGSAAVAMNYPAAVPQLPTLPGAEPVPVLSTPVAAADPNAALTPSAASNESSSLVMSVPTIDVQLLQPLSSPGSSEQAQVPAVPVLPSL